MKIRYGIVGAIVCLLLAATIYLHNPGEEQSPGAEAVVSDQQAIAKKMQEPFSERKKRVKGMAKADSPQFYDEWNRGIRTGDGETAPGYALNYQVDELLKARGMKSTVELAGASHKGLIAWRQRGPGNVGGRTRSILVDPRDPNLDTWLVGSVGGGVWKTTDAGQNWNPLSADLPNLATSALAWSESNYDIIYVGTGEGFGNVDNIDGSGIWKSTDAGGSWQQLISTATNPDFTNVTRLIVDPDNPDIVLASVTPGFNFSLGPALGSGIYRSADGGITWTKTYTGSSSVEHLIANPHNFNTQFATVNGAAVVKSTDGGLTWTSSSTGIFSVQRMEIAISEADTNVLYISAQVTTGSRLYGSEDAGATWHTFVDSTGANINWLGGQGWYDNTLDINPYNANQLFVAGINIWKIDIFRRPTTTDRMLVTNVTDGYSQFGGSSKGVHVDHHNIVIVKSDTATQSYRFLNGNDGGIAFSDDATQSFSQTGDFGRGAPPNEILTGYVTTQFYGVDKAPGVDRYIGGTQDNGTWFSPADPDSQVSWFSAPSGDGFECAWHYGDVNKMMETSQFNGIYRSLNSGNTWEFIGSRLDNGGGSAPFFTKLAKSKQDPDLVFALGSSGVWRSDNFGTTWTRTTMPGGYVGTSSFSQVNISLVNPQIVWSIRNMTISSPPFVSTDGGLSFTGTNIYTDVTLGRVAGFETHPAEDSTAFALLGIKGRPKVLRTTDLGQSWEDLSGFGTGSTSSNGFPDVVVFSLLVMPYDNNVIWAGTEIGIFQSIDNGQNWAYLNNGFPAVAAYEMVIVNDEIVVATHGRGIWSLEVPQLAGYEPPAVTLAPRFANVTGGPGGFISLLATLSSPYDSSVVLLDDVPVVTIGANAAAVDTLINLTVSATTFSTVNVRIEAYKDGNALTSASQSIDVFPLATAQPSYLNDFNSPGDDFVGNGFSITTPGGFADAAIHTQHNYSNNIEYNYILTVPIVVSSTNSLINFDEIALVEPGDPGSVFGSSNFWDYVIVEGSNPRQLNWQPLLDGYDARANAGWLSTFNLGGGGHSGLYNKRTIDLRSTFAANDTVIIRFRLFADAAVTGWGWAVDNLEIQDSFTAIGDDDLAPGRYSLAQNYPNPFNPETTIAFTLATVGKVKINIYNVLGQKVRTLLDENRAAGVHRIQWDGTGENGVKVASGVYLYRITAGDFVSQRKMILLK